MADRVTFSFQKGGLYNTCAYKLCAAFFFLVQYVQRHLPLDICIQIFRMKKKDIFNKYIGYLNEKFNYKINFGYY